MFYFVKLYEELRHGTLLPIAVSRLDLEHTGRLLSWGDFNRSLVLASSKKSWTALTMLAAGYAARRCYDEFNF